MERMAKSSCRTRLVISDKALAPLLEQFSLEVCNPLENVGVCLAAWKCLMVDGTDTNAAGHQETEAMQPDEVFRRLHFIFDMLAVGERLPKF